MIVPGHGPVCGPGGARRPGRYLPVRAGPGRAGPRRRASPRSTPPARPTSARSPSWHDPERIVGNLHRAYAELDGAAPGADLDLVGAFGDMITYNGGQPLRCLA